MGKEKNAAASPGLLVRELFQFGIYKRSQGRIARQATVACCCWSMAMGAWRLHEFMLNSDTMVRTLVPWRDACWRGRGLRFGW